MMIVPLISISRSVRRLPIALQHFGWTTNPQVFGDAIHKTKSRLLNHFLDLIMLLWNRFPM